MGFFLQILVRNRESILVILVSALESGPHNPPIFFFGSNPSPSPCALGFACWGYSCPRLTYTTGVGLQVSDAWNEWQLFWKRYFVYAVFDAYFFHFCVTQRLIRMDAALYVLLSVTQYIFLFKKEIVHVTTVAYWIIPPLLLEYYEAEIQRVSIFFMESSFWNAAARQNTNFHMLRNSKAATLFSDRNKFKAKYFMWR